MRHPPSPPIPLRTLSSAPRKLASRRLGHRGLIFALLRTNSILRTLDHITLSILQEAAISGRAAAAEATNAHLQQLYLPTQSYGALSTHRATLFKAAAAKLEHRQDAAMLRVQLAIQSLSEAEGSMRYYYLQLESNLVRSDCQEYVRGDVIPMLAGWHFILRSLMTLTAWRML